MYVPAGQPGACNCATGSARAVDAEARRRQSIRCIVQGRLRSVICPEGGMVRVMKGEEGRLYTKE